MKILHIVNSKNSMKSCMSTSNYHKQVLTLLWKMYLTGQKYSFSLFLVASLYNYNLKNLLKKSKKEKKKTTQKMI